MVAAQYITGVDDAVADFLSRPVGTKESKIIDVEQIRTAND